MKAVILAAGAGTRLRPLTEWIPKPLLPIHGTPILETLLRGLAAAGVREIRIVVGHLAEPVRRFVGDGGRFGVVVGFAEQPKPRGTADALLRVADFLDDATFVLAGDTALGPEHLARLARFHRERSADVTLCLKRVPRSVLQRSSAVALEPDGRVTDFVEKPLPGQEPGELASAMAHVHTPALLPYLAAVAPSERGELELTTAVRAMIHDDRSVVGLELPRPPDLTDLRDLMRLNFPYVAGLGGPEDP
jgi:NDP-sugar pyrophosphorylase family protein